MLGFSAFAVAIGVASPVHAQSNDGVLASAAQCLERHDEIDAVLDGLQDEGWIVSTPVTDDVVNALAWNLIARYFAGDSGGASLQDIYDLQQTTMRAYVNKQDIPASKSRVLTRDTDAVHVLWRKNIAKVIEIECRFVVDAPRMQDIRADAGFASDAGQDFVALPDTNNSQGHAQNIIQITLLNRKALAQQIGQPVPVDAIIHTYQSFGFQE